MYKKPGRLRKLFTIFITIAAAWCLMIHPAVAEEGDGSGGGQEVGLALVSSTPANGANDVALDSRIKLTFNKNIVNMSVQTNNRSCFNLSGGGKAVAFNLVMADDQVNPEGKRDIILVPQKSLLPGTNYIVSISPGLKAKNGSVLGQEVKIQFTTVGEAGSATATAPRESSNSGSSTASRPNTYGAKTGQEAADNSGQGQVGMETKSHETEPVSAGGKNRHEGQSPAPEAQSDTGSSTPIRSNMVVIGIILILAAAGLVYATRRKGKK